MMRIFSLLGLLFAAVLIQAASPASAASLGDTRVLAQVMGANVTKTGGCLGEGCYEEEYRARPPVYERDEDADDDEEIYRERHTYYWSGGRDYCWSCAHRCQDGWCPQQCWGWWRQCRWGRHDY